MAIYGPRSISALPVLQKMPHDLSVQADLGASHPLFDPNFRRGGYGLYSTVSDYMAFANMLLTGRAPSGDIILSSAMMDMARAVRVSFAQNTFRINDEPFSGYGWGLLGRVMENIGQAQYPTISRKRLIINTEGILRKTDPYCTRHVHHCRAEDDIATRCTPF